MPDQFRIHIQPVTGIATESVVETLLHFLGPDSQARGRELVRSGGTMLEGLNEDVAKNIADQLREAGVQVEVLPMDDSAGGSFRVRLVSFGEHKIHVIKEVREITGLGLRESKALVDNLEVVKEDIGRLAAQNIKAKLEAVGATVVVERIGGQEDKEQGERFVVYGRVRRSDGEPVAGVLVRAFDRDLRTEQPLGEPPPGLPKDSLPGSFTDKDGNYKIIYTRDQFRRAEKHRADLLLRVYNEVRNPLNVEPSEIHYNARPEEEVDLQIAQGEPVEPSEYERLLVFLESVMEGVKPADLTQDDITFLSRDTEIEAFDEEFPSGTDSIAFLAQASALDRQLGITAPVFYGWARQGVGVVRRDDAVMLDISRLLAHENETLRNELAAAIEKNIVPSRLLDEMDAISNRLTELGAERGFLSAHRLVGQLRSEENQQPLIGYRIDASESVEEGPPIAAAVTDVQGRFELIYRSKSDNPGTDRDLLLKVFGSEGSELARQEVPAGQTKPVILTAKPQKEPAPALPGEQFKLNRLDEIPDFDPPEDLSDALVELDATSLADIRRLSGQGRLDHLADTVGDEPARILKAHADLSLVTPDVDTAAQLIKQGYESPLKIAATPIETFLDTNQAALGTQTAMEVALSARATTSYLDAAMTGLVLDLDRLAAEETFPGLGIDLDDIKNLAPEPKCRCDCHHALSPSAYLADLLDYLTTHLDLTGPGKLTLAFLYERFHQPFDRFPDVCEFMTAPVRQVRIGVEVVRSYLAAQHPAPDGQQLSSAIRNYLFSVFRQILARLGTTFEELRRAQTDADLQSALAARLGIAPPNLDSGQLFFEHDQLSEIRLENLFGFQVTNNPLHTIDDQPTFLQWQFENLHRNWLSQDHHTEDDAVEFPIIDPDLVEPHELAHPRHQTISILNERGRFVQRVLNQLEARPKNLAGLDQTLLEAFGTARAELKEKDRDLSKGHEITTYLTDHGMRLAEFAVLIEAVRTLENGNDLLEATWQTIHAVAVMVKKRSKYLSWQQEEANAEITLSPDFFVFERRDLTELVEQDPALQWRIDLHQRRRWENTLKARLDRKESLSNALNQAVSAVEEQALPDLRDQLIVLSDATGTTLEEKAEWLTEQLQIDVHSSGCRVTTRVAQAIETLQNLVFSVRTGQLEPRVATFEPLPQSFDEDWKWMGSYATWKAATAVYLYPETLLHPTLRTRKTPAFNKLAQKLRTNETDADRRIKEIIAEYYTYISDVSNLKVTAGVWTKAHGNIDKIVGDLAHPPGARILLLFGQADNDGRLYYCTFRPTMARRAQSLWQPLPEAARNWSEIAGALPYKSTSEAYEDVYLFLKQPPETSRRIGVMHLSMKTGWQQQVYSFNLPENVPKPVTTIVQQLAGNNPPSVLVNEDGYSRNGIFIGAFDRSKTELSWTKLSYPDIYSTFANDISGQIGSGRWITPENFQFVHPLFAFQTAPGVFWMIADPSGTDGLLLTLVGAESGSYTIELSPPHRSPGHIQAVLDENGSILIKFWEAAAPAKLMSMKFNPMRPPFSTDAFSDRTETTRPEYRGMSLPISGKPQRIFYGHRGQPNETALEEYRDGQRYLEGDPSRTSNPAPTNIDFGDIPTSDRKLSLNSLIQKYNTNTQTALSVASSKIYIEEAYYFTPILIAKHFERSGRFTTALDWYRHVYADKEVFMHGFLEAAASSGHGWVRPDDWFRDPLNPHSIARSRRGAYLRYTLTSIIGCLIEYGDEAFTRDTAESLARARTLYTSALELLDTKVPGIERKGCEELAVDILNAVEDPGQRSLYHRFLAPALAGATRDETIDLSKAILEIHRQTDTGIEDKLAKIQRLVENAVESRDIETFENLTTHRRTTRTRAFQLLSTSPGFAGPLAAIISDVQNGLRSGDLTDLLGDTPGRPLTFDDLSGNLIPWLRPAYVPTASFQFCVRPNPALAALRQHALLNLHKLRTCRNIAGLHREAEFYAAPVDVDSAVPKVGVSGGVSLATLSSRPPTLYRYDVLANRAKELAGLAQQIEAAYLSAMQNRDAELYGRLKAAQDIQLARAGVRLQDLRVEQAGQEVTLAELQQDRAGIQVDHYRNLIGQGLIGLEKRAIEAMLVSAGFSTAASIAYGAAAAQDVVKSIFTLGLAGNSGEQLAASFSSLASAASTTASIFSTHASYERREQEWKFAQRLAEQDVRIGRQQVRLAEGAVHMAAQELAIANLQTDHAEATADFLATKQLNAELYDWMSAVLRRVYAFFLQQATATARLAEHQLAFERQISLPGFIRDGYWTATFDFIDSASSPGNDPVDRLGLTGSARLLQDVYQLDQYAFRTDERKQQLDITISLAQRDPFAFQKFRETGVMNFDTPMELFDRRFPGQYLRLIKRVRTSVVALVPPVQGVSARLTSSGISRVTIGGSVFQNTVIRRQPETVSFTSPAGATGVFELNPNPEMLLPFEGNGVDTRWEFCLPKAANPIDYSTIADVLLSVEYTALHSAAYQQQVQRDLGPEASADRYFSFRQEFADAWYDLHNPELVAEDLKMRVSFKTRREDFPPNLDNLRIRHLVLYFSRKDDAGSLEVEIEHLNFTEQGHAEIVGGGAVSIDGVVSTRRGNAASWISPASGQNGLIGRLPFGVWELALPNTEDIVNWFKNEQIKDILFVITYEGQTPGWPA